MTFLFPAIHKDSLAASKSHLYLPYLLLVHTSEQGSLVIVPTPERDHVLWATSRVMTRMKRWGGEEEGPVIWTCFEI